MICQDNKEPGDWLRPVDALSLAKVRIENRKLVEELNEWKRFALSNYQTLCSISAPRLLPRDQQRIAQIQIERAEKEFPAIMEEVNGPIWEKRG